MTREDNAHAVAAVRSLMLNAFGQRRPPPIGELVDPAIAAHWSYERDVLRNELGGKRWTEVRNSWIREHSEWLAYLTPRAFAYYLPAYCLAPVVLMHQEYASSFLLHFFGQARSTEPKDDEYRDRLIAALTADELASVQAWYCFMQSAHGEEVEPPADDSYLGRLVRSGNVR